MNISRIKNILISAVLLGASSTANAAFISTIDGSEISDLNSVTSTVLNVDDNSGQLMGAFNVNVSGTLYDVVFVDGTFNSIFANGSGYDATDLASATSFARALLDTVFLDVGRYQYDFRPFNINGCGYTACVAHIPFPDFANITGISTGTAVNLLANNVDYVSNYTFLADEDITILTFHTYADFSLSSDRLIAQVSEPSILAMLLFGGLCCVQRKKLSLPKFRLS